MLMLKFRKRIKVANKMAGLILPSILRDLNEKSRNLCYEVQPSSDTMAKVIGKDILCYFRHIVDLHAWT
uniref:Uncharacterized protein n=1 Tax=Arundo donax TaxID=35708 RepID=A0A0A9C7X5_ARUDO